MQGKCMALGCLEVPPLLEAPSLLPWSGMEMTVLSAWSPCSELSIINLTEFLVGGKGFKLSIIAHSFLICC